MNFIQQKTERKKKISKKIKPCNDSLVFIHNNKLKHFEDLQLNVLPKKIIELSKLKPTDTYNISIVKKEINDIKTRKEENEYFLIAIRIYQEYITLNDSFTSGNNSDDFFIKKKDIINNYNVALGLSTNYSLHDSYINIYNCSSCNNNNCVVESVDCFSCKLCGVLTSTQTYPTELSYQEKKEKDPTSNNIGYKRVNYLIECMTQMQANETFVISDDVIDKVLIEIKKEKIIDTIKLNYRDIRRYLKKTGCSKYYEHSPLILSHITGVKPPQIPKQIEDKLIWMFKEIQQPYDHFKPTNRTSCFNYPYMINKLLQLLELEEFRQYFKLLEDRKKLYLQDATWKKVVEYLAQNKKTRDTYDIPWRFISSV